ncbi:MAG: hypothetical protein OXI33_00160 [Chloroflexota bacterium]|nr:hypothetical protein [Chloroflexota bacterium]
MSRLGQGDLSVLNRRVGTIWVSRVAADAALQPRIALSAGCQVQDLRPTDEFPEGVVTFRIAALGGQLRWRSETGSVVGDLSIPKGLQHFRSTNHAHEHTFTMYCDMPHHVLSRLEAERGGSAPVFWMDLAGSWAMAGSIQPIYQRPWRFRVPTDMWIEFLSESGYEDFEIVEVRRVLKEGGSLQRAVDHLNVARRLASSDPPRAVGICRLLVEALDKDLRDQGYGVITHHLMACTDELRGREYGRIVAAVKQLASMNHHDFGRHSVFTRPEALALVRLCEALLLMVGDLAPLPLADSEEGAQG